MTFFRNMLNFWVASPGAVYTVVVILLFVLACFSVNALTLVNCLNGAENIDAVQNLCVENAAVRGLVFSKLFIVAFPLGFAVSASFAAALSRT